MEAVYEAVVFEAQVTELVCDEVLGRHELVDAARLWGELRLQFLEEYVTEVESALYRANVDLAEARSDEEAWFAERELAVERLCGVIDLCDRTDPRTLTPGFVAAVRAAASGGG
jgi:hypothetical protein